MATSTITSVDIHDLPARLDEILALAQAGQEIVLVANGAPLAKLLPMSAPVTRQFDLHPGAFVVGPEFDDPLPADVWPSDS